MTAFERVGATVYAREPAGCAMTEFEDVSSTLYASRLPGRAVP
jgi:hypothetical protein